MFKGTMGIYKWIEFREENEGLIIPHLISWLKPILKGLYALNTSFDSGLYLPTKLDIQLGWSRIGDRAISPPLTESILDSFPDKNMGSECAGYNEWYFFRDYPKGVPTGVFCNWQGLSIAKHADVKFLHDFEADIHRCLPELVMGEGTFLYLIYKSKYQQEIFKLMPKDET